MRRLALAALAALPFVLLATGCDPQCVDNWDCQYAQTGDVCFQNRCVPLDCRQASRTWECNRDSEVCDPADGKCKTCFADNNTGCDPGNVCDVAASSGAGACVECLGNANCSAPTAYCNTTEQVCNACLDTAGAGVTDTGCATPTPICDTTADACVECVADGDCSGEVCDLTAQTCKTCLASNHGCSATSAIPACDTAANSGAGACVECTATTLTACTGTSTPECDATNHVCVVCADTAAVGQDQGCAAATPICDAAAASGDGACVGCMGNTDCAVAAPVCDVAASKTCKVCLAGGTGCVATATCNTAANGGVGACTCATHADCTIVQDCSGTPAICTNAAGTASADIGSVHAGTATYPVTIAGAIVTLTRPAIGGDPAGFFIQAEQTGPALFVQGDATVTPVVGDRISVSITSATTYGSMETGVMVPASYTVISSGHNVAALLQDVSSQAFAAATDVYNFESEYVNFTGDVPAGATQGASGSANYQMAIATAGQTTGASFKLRYGENLADQLSLAPGCHVVVNNAPLWRFNTTAQPMIFALSQITVSGCPAPTVVSATASSSTTVRVSFDRYIDPASVLANGSQFTFTAGTPTVSGATVNGKSVTLTTTTQVAHEAMTVSVAATVLDTTGAGVSQTANTASFVGVGALATVLVNEVNPNIGSNKDLIELLVTGSGTTAGMQLYQDVTPVERKLLATLPDVDVAAGDLIVVHLSPTDPTAPPEAPANETTAKNQYPNATYASNFDSAWDFYGPPAASGGIGITFSGRVINVRGPNGNVMDGVPFVRGGTSNPPAVFASQLKAMFDAGQWAVETCGTTLCTDAAPVWGAAGTAITGNSAQRGSQTDANAVADWGADAVAQTWGALNAGQ